MGEVATPEACGWGHRLETYTPPPLSPALTTTSTYNADGQITSTQFPEGTAYATLGRTYDSAGRLTTVTDSQAHDTQTLTYTPADRPLSIATSAGETLSYG